MLATTSSSRISNVVAAGDDHGVFVWVDMEDYTTTDVTLDAYDELVPELDGGWDCACRRTSSARPTTSNASPTCRGRSASSRARTTNRPRSPTSRKAVNEAYRDCLELMFEEFDGGIGVGSHDPAMIDYARDLHDEYGTDYEVQMLMGVREDGQRDLAADGIEMWQYVPYGDKWFSYFYRRVRERKENALFALRAVAALSYWPGRAVSLCFPKVFEQRCLRTPSFDASSRVEIPRGHA